MRQRCPLPTVDFPRKQTARGELDAPTHGDGGPLEGVQVLAGFPFDGSAVVPVGCDEGDRCE